MIIRDGSQEVPLSILLWSPDSIRVRLKDRASEPGFSGDVVVTSRGRKSKPRRLMAYRGTMTYTLRSLGSQTLRVELDLLGRFDPDRVRRAPGEEPTPQMGPHVFRTIPVPVAEAHWEASGEGTDQDCTIRWSGSGTISLGTGGVYFYVGRLYPASRTLASTFAAGTTAATGYTETWICEDETFHEPESVWAHSSDFENPPDGSIPMQVDYDWKIVGATRTGAISEGPLTLQWTTISPVPAFDPGQAK